MEGSHSTTKPIPHAYAIITDIIYMHNYRILKTFLLFLLLITSIHCLNTNNITTYEKKPISLGYTISDKNIQTTPLINLNNSTQTEILKNIIINQNISTKSLLENTSYINNYLINIFCSETTNKYIKVASGSGVFLSDPDEDTGVVLTNAHIARHILDSNKKCVGRTKSPTTTTHTVTLRYIPSFWLNKNNQYIIGDPDQNSTGEFDFAIVEVKRIKPIKKDSSNIYTVFKSKLRLKTDNYDNQSLIDNTYIYSYPARSILSKNVNNPLFQKKDTVKISNIYSSPTYNISNSLLDVSGSQNIDHGSSGGMVISQGQNNYLLGLSSVMIREDKPQIIRVVTLKHVLTTIKNDLALINNAQADPFSIIIDQMLSNKENELTVAQIFKNIKLTSVLEKNTKDTLIRLGVIK